MPAAQAAAQYTQRRGLAISHHINVSQTACMRTSTLVVDELQGWPKVNRRSADATIAIVWARTRQ